MPGIPGHQRNVSQGQHLIVDRNESGDEEDLEKARSHKTETTICEVEAPFGNGGVYPGGSSPYVVSRPQDNKAKGLCHDPHLRANIRVILGSVLLTVAGIVLLVLGCIVAFQTQEERDTAGMQHWVFYFAGFVCFIPGFYHVYYVVCTLCGRPGYSFDKLPTFNRT
ncbi:unnamed protein product [Caenorhabditis auriculariae]|uniref:Transmembrane protein 230 n=1 Tax=Caenorhabditis auriculariae TaxID=2777116 RepID=A0A8S1GME4_9PELO|nr:unnamed protein product [Caenorhabditis auriculariae]